MCFERLTERLTAGDIPEDHSPVDVPLARVLPSGLKATLNTELECALSGSPRGLRLATSQRTTVLSALPMARVLPLGTEGNARHRTRVCFERLTYRLTAGDIPENHRAVEAAGGKGFTIGAEGNALHAIRMCFEWLAERLAAGNIPEDYIPS